jgi:methylmalonyl-CoA/ethylmalonyl-CoA epimerase
MLGPLVGCPVIQLGYVVRDLDRAIAVLGGDWLRPPAPPAGFYAEVTYPGGEAVLDHLVALRKREHPQVELIQPGRGPNIWNDWLDGGNEGLHHLGVDAEAPFEAIPAMEAAGYPCVMTGRFGGDGAFAYFDTVAAAGIYVEALRLPAMLRRRPGSDRWPS